MSCQRESSQTPYEQLDSSAVAQPSQQADKRFVCQAGSIAFLAANKFDFSASCRRAIALNSVFALADKWINQGVGYASHDTEANLRAEFAKRKVSCFGITDANCLAATGTRGYAARDRSADSTARCRVARWDRETKSARSPCDALLRCLISSCAQFVLGNWLLPLSLHRQQRLSSQILMAMLRWRPLLRKHHNSSSSSHSWFRFALQHVSMH